ncbi:hypothetical protein ACHAWF_006397 [Thalassiosira exigua]
MILLGTDLQGGMSSVLTAAALFLFWTAKARVVAVNESLSAESGCEWCEQWWEPSLEEIDRRLNFPFYYVDPSSTDFEEIHTTDTDGEPSFYELQTALYYYRERAENLVHHLTISHEIASRTEDFLFPHHKRRYANGSASRNARYFTSDKPIPSPGDNLDGLDDQGEPQSCVQNVQQLAMYIPPHNSESNSDEEDWEAEPYETASHIITHFARDWTAKGAPVRKDTHNWIIKQLWNHHSDRVQGQSHLPLESKSSDESPLSPVLVPGAGMARLAFDIAFAHNENKDGTKLYPFAVEAIDNSIVMAAAAFDLLHHRSINGHTDHSGETEKEHLKVYPFVTDSFENEVDTQRRWESAVFPENDVSDHFHHLRNQQSSHGPSLSYFVGDFVSMYSSSSKHAAFGAIATSFFPRRGFKHL